MLPTVRRHARILGVAVSSALLSGVTCAIIEYALTLSRTRHTLTDTRELLGLLIALYGLAALALGLVQGAVLSGLLATGAIDEGRRLLRRVAAEERFDRNVAAGLAGGALSLVGFGLWVAALAWELVAHSVRQLVGAAICGMVAGLSLPLFVLLGFPLAKMFSPLVRGLPRLRGLPVSALTGLALLIIGATGMARYIDRSLDWRAMHLAPFVGGALVLGAQAGWASLLFFLLGRVQRFQRARRPLFLAGVLAVPVLGLINLGGAPSAATGALLFQASYGGRLMAEAAQRLFDRDHDGWSTLLGGGDCDDRDRTVHPGARDWPDDGIDQNCLGGDAHFRAPETSPDRVAGGFQFRGNLLMIFIDTLRADGIDPEHTPVLEAMAQNGVRFRRAFAQAPGTSRSYPSLVTSRLPSQITWDESFRDSPGMLLANHSLFESLHEGGWHTVGVASHFYFTTPGLDQGFEEFDNTGALEPAAAEHDVSAPRLVARVERILARLEGSDRPFAMMVHLTEPHAAYEPHPEVRAGRPAPATLEGEYAEEVTYVDGQVGKLLEILKRRHLDKSTMVVVFSDHGEAFGLHREYGEAVFRHGRSLYDDLLQVPLMVSAPGLQPHEVAQPVSLLDVAPTVLDVLGVARPKSFQGRSLAGALAGQPLAPAPVYAEMQPRPTWPQTARAIIDSDGRTKVIYRITQPRFEIYDLITDPLELHDLSMSRPDLVERMRAKMAEWQDGPQ